MSVTAPASAQHPWHLSSPPSVREVVTERVRRAILEQEIRPGSRVRQVQLADALGVSRMPVRDAIQELLVEGLLEALPHGGVRVPPFDITDVLDALALRGPLEAEALRAVVARGLTEMELERLERADTGLAMHRALADLSDNRFLVAALSPVWTQVERAAHALPASAVCLPGCPDHARLVAAIRAGDHAEGARTLEGHLAAVRDEVAGRGSSGRAAS